MKISNVLCVLSAVFVASCVSAPPKPDEAAQREASLVSPIPSSVEGTSITNVHLVDQSAGRVYRGMRIRNASDVQNLRATTGLTDVLIFRADSKGVGVQAELDLLAKEGVARDAVTHIPFEWNKIPSFQVACRQSLQALALMRSAVSTPGKSLFLHCTVGEDRTGYISALYKMLYAGLNSEKAFKYEMCARGYADGNATKPAHVSDQIHANITPVFLKMKHLVSKNPKRLQRLDASLCDQDPLETDPSFAATYAQELVRHRCVGF